MVLLLLLIVVGLINLTAGGRNCYVTIKSARALKSSDQYSYSDPFVVMYGKYDHFYSFYYLFKTSTKWNNENNPIWNEGYLIKNAAYDYLYFQVYDADVTSPHDYMADTDWQDVELNKLKCFSNNLMTLQLNSDNDGDEGSLTINVWCNCFEEKKD
eukprot:272404_1